MTMDACTLAIIPKDQVTIQHMQEILGTCIRSQFLSNVHEILYSLWWGFFFQWGAWIKKYVALNFALYFLCNTCKIHIFLKFGLTWYRMQLSKKNPCQGCKNLTLGEVKKFVDPIGQVRKKIILILIHYNLLICIVKVFEFFLTHSHNSLSKNL